MLEFRATKSMAVRSSELEPLALEPGNAYSPLFASGKNFDYVECYLLLPK